LIREGYAGMADTAAARDDVAFREEVCSFIRDHYPHEMRVAAPYEELDKEQQLLRHRVLNNKGWSAPQWPPAYGGSEAGKSVVYAHRLALRVELGVPRRF